jgi:conjugative relaxase-like TrwC/TraI family protein
MTVRKIGVTVGDAWAAGRAARYSLDRGEAPSAFARAGYYTAEEAGLAQERPNVIWLGTQPTLDKLGYERGTAVAEEQLAAALQGLDAEGNRVRRPGTRSVPTGEIGPDGTPVEIREARVNSADLTFSAPKSVSVVWSQASPELREKIERAMFEAANAGLEHMMRTKPVIQGKGVPATGFAASAALQVTARTARGDAVPAPQLHVHGVVVGVDDGGERLLTPDTAALFKDDAPLEGGAVFRARLAEELRAIGFDLEAGTGRNARFFEIVGVPRGLAEAMSPRTREVLRTAAQIEAQTGMKLSGAALGAVAMMSRAAKDKSVTAEQITEAWDDLAAEFDFDRDSIEGLRGRPRTSRSLDELRAEGRDAILARLREQGPTVSAGVARAIAYEVAPMGLTLQQASDLLVELQREGELVALEGKVAEGEEGRRRVMVTSREIRALEQEVMATAATAARFGGAGLSEAAVAAGTATADRSLGEGKALDDKQQDAIRTLTSGAGWTTLTGRAGTGKGPVLEAVSVAHRADGWQVIAGAVDGATAQRLGHQIKAPALTIDQILYREGEGDLRLDNRTVILIEEASKVGLEHWGAIARLVRRDGVRVIAIGHAGQLGAIELPGMFEQMLADAGVPTSELTAIHRHRNPLNPSERHPWLAEYQTLLDEGHGQEAVAKLREHDAISMHATREESIEALVDGWDARRRGYEDARDAILVVHGANEDVDRVNELAQERRIRAGNLGEESVQAVDRTYRLHRGDVVMLRESAYSPDDGDRRVENGTIGIVDSVDARDHVVRVRLEEPGVGARVVEFDQRALRDRVLRGDHQVPALRLAYAFHPFPLQGATVKDVAVLAGHWSQDKEGTYTADTRAEWYLHVHVDRESLGLDGGDDDRYLRYGKRVMSSQERMASLALDEIDHDLAIELPDIADLPDWWFAPYQVEQTPREKMPTLAQTLDRHRNVLGDLRADRLAAMADAQREDVRGLGTGALREAAMAIGDPFLRLDRDGARATLRIERDKEVVNERVDAAEAEAQQLEAQAEQTPRRRGRSTLLDAAGAQRELASRDLDRLGALHDDETDLRERGRHLDGWWDEHAEDAARRLAIDDELARREELDRALEDELHEREAERELDLEVPEPPSLEM